MTVLLRAFGDLREPIPEAQLRTYDPQLTWFRASTRKVDRHRSIVEPSGFDLTDYNGTFGWGHDVYGRYDGSSPPPENVLGSVRDNVIEHEFFDIGVDWARHERASLVREMIDDGIINSVSVGFIPKAIGQIEHPDGTGEVLDHYTEQDLLEVSAVIIPSNADALALAVSRCAAAQLPLSTTLQSVRIAASAREGADSGDDAATQRDLTGARLRMARERMAQHRDRG